MRRRITTIALALSLVGGLVGSVGGVRTARAEAVTASAAVPRVERFEPLRLGSTGPRVRQVQEKLRATGSTVSMDGTFGPKTRAAVKQFQKAKRLLADGIVGPRTWAALGLGAPPVGDPPPVPGGGYTHPNPTIERWHADALAAGWTDSQWTRLSCIMQRESGGVPTAKNPRSSAMGLLQIMWSAHSRWIGGSSSQLYDGPTNLRLGRQLFDRAGGWSPWISTSSGC